MVSPALHQLRAGENCPVIALGAAGGEENLRRLCTQRAGKLLAGAFKCLAGVSSHSMRGAWVSIVFGHYIISGVCCLAADHCCCRVVEIYRHYWFLHARGWLLFSRADDIITQNQSVYKVKV